MSESAPLVTPAARRARVLAIATACLFGLLAARAVQLSFSGEPSIVRSAAPSPTTTSAPARGDLVDRNGVLLAATLPSYVLAVKPTANVDAEDVARLVAKVPDLSAEEVLRKLRAPGALVYLKYGLTESQRQTVHDLGIPWTRFDTEQRRVYPNRALAGHVIGYANRQFAGVQGSERTLQKQIVRAGASGGSVKLSLDVRIQFAVEQELEEAVRRSNAKGGGAIVLDGQTGETLALASWPKLDPNQGGDAPADARRSRASDHLFEVGSIVKPFVVAMAMDEKATFPGETFNLSGPLDVDGNAIRDDHPLGSRASLQDALSHSSNQAMAILSLRVGGEAQRGYFERLGLLDPEPIEGVASEKPRARDDGKRITVATLGYGYAMQTSLAAMAGAYTAFVNDGVRVKPTILWRDAGDPVPKTPVFSFGTAHDTLGLMREVVVEGTAKSADLARFDIAGKTGTAEKTKPGGGYDPDKVLASFVAIFPASAPRYVILLALDEPQRLPENKNLITGGALAAPAVGRIAARMAPFVGIAPLAFAERAQSAGGAYR